MDPNQQPTQYNPQPDNQPADPLNVGYGVVPPQSSVPAGVPPTTSSSSKKNRLPLMAATAVVGLLLIVSLVVVLTSKKPPSSNKPKATTSDTGASSFLRPANAIGVEQTSNSISQDLSGLNDDSDLPPGKLDDKALGL